MAYIDLSADIGESFGSYRMGQDDLIVQSLTSANIACGFHAGDPRSMQTAVAQCVQAGVSIGAHPGFHDLVGFGRRLMNISSNELKTDVLYQLGALHAFAAAAGTRVGHVSPHGSLGNLVTQHDDFAIPVLDAITSFDPELVVVTYSGRLHQLASERGLRVGLLGFPDRAYEADGSLVDRKHPDAVIHDPETIAERALALASGGSVTARTGETIHISCQSLLLHGDNDASATAAQRVRKVLIDHGIDLLPLDLQDLGADSRTES